MNRLLLPRLILLLGLGLPPLAAREFQAVGIQGPGQARRHPPEQMAQRAERVAKHLNLTDDQRARIKAIHDKHQGELKVRREAMKQARKRFHEAEKNPDTPLDQLRKLHQDLSDQTFDMVATRRAVRLETRQVLSPDQREKAAEARGRMAERRKQRGEHIRALMGDH